MLRNRFKKIQIKIFSHSFVHLFYVILNFLCSSQIIYHGFIALLFLIFKFEDYFFAVWTSENSLSSSVKHPKFCYYCLCKVSKQYRCPILTCTSSYHMCECFSSKMSFPCLMQLVFDHCLLSVLKLA